MKKLEQNLESLLLDSRLITRVEFEAYNCKIVRCGDYVQVYYYTDKKIRSNIKNLDLNGLKKSSSIVFSEQERFQLFKKIENRNIIRSKLNCQRLAKANSKEWKSFITLTYAENMQDVQKGKIDLNFFIKNIKKIYKDFKYIAIPEFQKRGALHFHLLTNLSKDNKLIFLQKDSDKFYHIKYWSKGFTRVDFINNDIKKIIGYISKYMTEECDDRLFNIKRYTSSQNLIKPIEEFIDFNINFKYLNRILKDKEIIYTNTYLDNENNDVHFIEYYKKEE